MKNNIAIRTSCLILSVILSVIVFNSCRTTQQAVDSKDLSYLYNPTKNSINPRYNVYNQSDEQSVLSVKFFANDLFFSEANPQGVPTAQMLFNVKLYNIKPGEDNWLILQFIISALSRRKEDLNMFMKYR